MPVPTPARTLGHLLTTLLVLPLLVLGGLAAAPTAGPAGGGAATATVRADDSLRLVAGANRVQRALRIALAQKGDPYRYGAAGPNRFDCSGLVYYATHRAGLKGVPRTSSAQARYVDRIKRSRMRPGDFVFFTGSGGVYHVGIYVGWRDGRRAVVHSPRSGSRVHVARIWTNSWYAGTLR
jgi:cell wall-associated NlpC family hydrolase